MHDSSGNMAVNLNFIYLHRNFVNRSFLLLNKKWNSLQVFTLTSEKGGLVTITFEINMASLVLGRHVRLFVVDDILSKLKGFSFNKGKVKEVIVWIGSYLHFHREKDLSTFSPLDLIESDMWRWDVLSVSISLPFIVMFLTYNCCAKWPLRIVWTFQNLC